MKNLRVDNIAICSFITEKYDLQLVNEQDVTQTSDKKKVKGVHSSIVKRMNQFDHCLDRVLNKTTFRENKNVFKWYLNRIRTI